jgi:hypothetical protein
MLAEVRQREYRLFAANAGVVTAATPQPQWDGVTTHTRRSHIAPANQNRKYRCAIGSTSAGAQVSNSPSARTS